MMKMSRCSLNKYPVIFINHGGGPLPLLGQQPEIVQQLKDARTKWLPKEKPNAIVIFSAHWESDPVKVMSSPNPTMYYDYGGFPPESYTFQYTAPGSPDLAHKIQRLLTKAGIKSELDPNRGFDHGVFIPLMLMFPEADIPVVAISLHSSLSAVENIRIGKALSTLREEESENILFLGSGQSFHNLRALFNPTSNSKHAAKSFNEWLKSTMLKDLEGGESNDDNLKSRLLDNLMMWDASPGGRISHPREEHLLPLLICAGVAGEDSKPNLIFEADFMGHPVSSYLFP